MQIAKKAMPMIAFFLVALLLITFIHGTFYWNLLEERHEKILLQLLQAKKRRILHVVPVLAAAGIFALFLPDVVLPMRKCSVILATGNRKSPEDTVTQLFAEKIRRRSI